MSALNSLIDEKTKGIDKIQKTQNSEIGKSEDNVTKIIYNNEISIENILEQACEYLVNGKPAIEGVIGQQRVSNDKTQVSQMM